MGREVRRYTPAEILGKLKFSLSPLLACTCTCTTGAVKSASRTSMDALRVAGLAVHVGAANGVLEGTTIVAVQVPLALDATASCPGGEAAVAVADNVTGRFTVTVLPGAALIVWLPVSVYERGTPTVATGAPIADALQLGLASEAEATPDTDGEIPGTDTEQVTTSGPIGFKQFGKKGGEANGNAVTGAPSAATAVRLGNAVTHPEGVLEKLITLGFAATEPSEKLGLKGVSPTKPLTRHCPEIPPPRPEINTEPRPRVTFGRKLTLSK
jgi:hypothetical protein